MSRFEKSSEENQRINEKYQIQIADLNKATENELRRGREKFDQSMSIINNQMSKLEEQLNQFQLDKVESEKQLRMEHREKMESLNEQNEALAEEVEILQKCLVELESKHKLIIHQQKEDNEKELESIKQQIYEQKQLIQKQKRELLEFKGTDEISESKQEGEEKTLKQNRENLFKQAEPSQQYVLFEQTTQKQRVTEGRQPSYSMHEPFEKRQIHPFHPQMLPFHPQMIPQQQFPPQAMYVSNGFEMQHQLQPQQFQVQDEATQLKMIIQNLQQENRQLSMSKSQEYSNFQEQLRNITNSAYLGRSPQHDFYSQVNRSRPF